MPLDMQEGLVPGPQHVRWGPSFPQKRGIADCQFLAHIYCGQTAGWIRILLGTELGLGPGDTVLDGDPAPLWKRGTTGPTFWPMSIVVKRLYISATAELLFSASFTRRRKRRSLIDWVRVSHPNWHKIRHFGDVLHSQSLGIVLKKLNLTEQKHTYTN